MRRTVRALPVVVEKRLHNSQRFRLHTAPVLSPKPIRIAQTPIPSS
jgi:hypothetical protein